ncbi:MAG: hypothetical protein K0R06_2190 [Clostridium sp.]|jgi:hypothetical protein|nr:hypothetical protein [Clostridium sp.]
MLNKKQYKSIVTTLGFCLITISTFITMSTSLFLLGEPTLPKSLSDK